MLCALAIRSDTSQSEGGTLYSQGSSHPMTFMASGGDSTRREPDSPGKEEGGSGRGRDRLRVKDQFSLSQPKSEKLASMVWLNFVLKGLNGPKDHP